MWKTAWRFAALLFVCTSGVPLRAQENPPALPQEVRDWMARDQVRRWGVMLTKGDSLFNSGTCQRCHGEGGTGSVRAPDLTDTDWVQSDGSLEGIRQTIFWGVRRRDLSDPSLRLEMNPAGGMHLEWEDYEALAAYVWSLSNGSHLPVRRSGGGRLW